MLVGVEYSTSFPVDRATVEIMSDVVLKLVREGIRLILCAPMEDLARQQEVSHHQDGTASNADVWDYMRGGA